MIYLIVALFLLGMAAFALFNPSYEKAFEAKWHYMMGEYDQAYTLAKEAYELDHYNRMAFTIMTQTDVSRRVLDYIREGHEYLKQIDQMLQQSPLPEDDRLRVKMMCEVMMEKYPKLAPTKLTDSKLVDESERIYKKFKTIYSTLF
jgi:hypothetical protein